MSENKILISIKGHYSVTNLRNMSIKGHNSVTNKQNMTSNNSNLDLVNINAYIKFGEILSICSQNIEREINF